MNYSSRPGKYISAARRPTFRPGRFTRPAAGFITVLIFALALACPILSANAAKTPKPDTEIKFATLAPEGSTWMKTMRALNVELRASTGNRLGFKFYTGGVQGDEKDVLRKMRNGQLHAGGFTGFGLGAVAPDVRALELPFMFRDYDELNYVRDQLADELSGYFEAKDFVLLGWADVGFIYMFSNIPVTAPADLQKVKMWIWSGDPLAELFFKSFQISPIPLSAPDVLTSLQTGVINAVYSSPLACIALQWFTRLSYMTDVPITHGLGAVLVSRQALAKVSAQDLEVLKEVCSKHLRALNEKTRIQNEEAVETLKKEGLSIVTVDETTRRQFFATGREAWQDGVGKLYSQELLDRITGLLQDYRSDGH
jgi:TRAP-type C4-dicarboxylate transport system substrate-binding protein